MDTRRLVVGVTQNEGINLLFARKMHEEAKVPFVYAMGEATHGGMMVEQFANAGVRLLFGNEIDSGFWSSHKPFQEWQSRHMHDVVLAYKLLLSCG